jgi:hypothetical protein
MRLWGSAAWAAISGLGFVSCAKDEAPGDVITGEISIPSRELSADISWNMAVAHASADRLLVFLTGAEGASCEKIAAYLGPNTGALPKDGVLDGGSCTLMLAVDGWDGSSKEGWPSEDATGYNPGLSSVLRCDFGDGEWVLETRAAEYEDYYWSGPVWAGVPTDFQWNIVGDESGVSVDFNAAAFDGNFPYDIDLSRYPADGNIGGSITASWCSEMELATAL